MEQSKNTKLPVDPTEGGDKLSDLEMARLRTRAVYRKAGGPPLRSLERDYLQDVRRRLHPELYPESDI